MAFRDFAPDDPLRSIQLLEILPRLRTDDRIECRRFTTTIDIPYCALLYECNHLAKKTEILVNGLPVEIGVDLRNILQVVMKIARRGSQNLLDDGKIDTRRAPRYLWVHTLCSNQKSEQERQLDMQQTTQIYERAQHIIAWLGDQSESAPDPTTTKIQFTIVPRDRISDILLSKTWSCRGSFFQNAISHQNSIFVARPEDLRLLLEEDHNNRHQDLTSCVNALVPRHIATGSAGNSARGSCSSPSGSDSSSRSRGTTRSTVPTSQDTTDKAIRILDYDDSNTIYSMNSAASDLYSEYIRIFAQKLEQDIAQSADNIHLSDIPASYISETLRVFAWKLHEESTTSFQRTTSVHLHRKRENITGYLAGDTNDEARSSSSDGSSTEGDEETQRHPFVKPPDLLPEWLSSLIGSAGGDPNSSETFHRNDTDELCLPHLADYEDFIMNSEAYHWLTSKLCQHEQLSFGNADNMSKIGTEIRNRLRELGSSRKMSHRDPLSIVSIDFDLDWSPSQYIEDQNLSVISSTLLDKVLCLTGSFYEAQALTISEYMHQTWPSTGVSILGLFEELLRLPDRKGCAEFKSEKHGSKLTASLTAGNSCIFSVTGGPYFVSETAEQIGWLVAALQQSSQNRAIVSVSPRIKDFVLCWPDASSDTTITGACTFAFDREEKSTDVATNGLCWGALFENANLIEGYPILKRPQARTGLELSLSLMAYLVRSDHVVQYKDRIMMKGHESLMVATSAMDDVLVWHLCAHKKPSERMSYFDHGSNSVRLDKDVSVSLRNLERSRHIVGWCIDVEELCGHATANMNISGAQLPRTPSSIVIDRLYLEGGMNLIGGLNLRINQKEEPTKLIAQRDYPSLLKWIALQPVVFFDSLERRAWLVDGASALLHLVNVSLWRDERDEDSPYDWVFNKMEVKNSWTNCTGRQAAIKTMKDFDNLSLNIYVKNIVIQDGNPIKQYSTLGERIMAILHSLEILVDLQARQAAKGEVRTLQSRDRRKFVTGYDVLDVIEPLEPISSRIAYFDTWGDGWMDLVQAIGAVTLFGRGFGDLIRPHKTASICAQWKALPLGNDYMCATTSTMKILHEKRLQRIGTSLKVGELTSKVLWASPVQPFDMCRCLSGQLPPDQEHRNPVQFLLSSKQSWKSALAPKDLTPMDITTLGQTGAVIFSNLGILGRRVTEKTEKAPEEGNLSPSSIMSASQTSASTSGATSSSVAHGTETMASTSTDVTSTAPPSPTQDPGELEKADVSKAKTGGKMKRISGLWKRK